MPRYKKSFLLCFSLWLLVYCTGYCQNIHGGLAVPKVAASMLAPTLTDLNGATADTAKIRILLNLSCIYYWQDKTKHHYEVDSAQFYAKLAMNSSSQIKFAEG